MHRQNGIDLTLRKSIVKEPRRSDDISAEIVARVPFCPEYGGTYCSISRLVLLRCHSLLLRKCNGAQGHTKEQTYEMPI